jgi:TamB, inner membrane protein subunit of TAM complex
LLVENMDFSLHTGTVSCLAATALFDQRGSLLFAHAPFLLDRCLLNIKKDLFAIVSGDVLFSQALQHIPCISGHIIIDRAQLKENLLSEVIQKQLFGYTNSLSTVSHIPIMCDLTIETKAPIKVDTALLQTNAHVNISVHKNIQEPAVSGTITLQGGSLVFPYKPLYIRGGTITFFPDQLFDPTIELVARNKIKKYDVALQVAGSLLTHHIMLDSTPPLSEEQIVALLLVGSEESSLNSMMPALIVQNVKNLIFSNNQSKFLEKYFKPLLRTFNISLVPSFTDQTGRGGLRGALEISVNDRWRAVIQKNFSLTEDTRFEIEFLLSDDIALRAIRDERRDLGGEVEMRWKF